MRQIQRIAKLKQDTNSISETSPDLDNQETKTGSVIINTNLREMLGIE